MVETEGDVIQQWTPRNDRVGRPIETDGASTARKEA